uniref:NAD(P)(+)--arginine ADP-ribosyltransferase n=1 Tax=Pelusios castaneus TaxID=367368 RepID=A0A8C8S9L6_9SAUR
ELVHKAGLCEENGHPTEASTVYAPKHQTFDDQYKGCTKDMENIIRSVLLEEEMSKNAKFRLVWGKAKEQWNAKKENLTLPQGFKNENGIALMAYIYGGKERLYREFNEAVRHAGQSRAYYLNRFPFKAFHFYLTRALQLLRGDCAKTYKTEVYRGVKSKFSAKKGDKIRFGTFTSSSLDRDVARRFGTDTFFTIRTCFGVPIANFSFNPREEEVLIPENEKFKVSQFTREGNRNEITLHSTKTTFSRYNCAYIKGHACSWSQVIIGQRRPRPGWRWAAENFSC